MRKVIGVAIGLLFSMKVIAQIPYFAGTVGDGKLYGYTSVKARPGINHQETYTTFQYGSLRYDVQMFKYLVNHQ